MSKANGFERWRKRGGVFGDEGPGIFDKEDGFNLVAPGAVGSGGDGDDNEVGTEDYR